MPSYLIAVLIAFIVWIVLFSFSKDTRKEMVVVGGLLTPFVILDILTTSSYWTPITIFNLPVGIEGFLFTFFITGIAAVIYEYILKKGYKGTKLHIFFTLWFIVPAIITVMIVYVFSLNVIYLFILGFTFMALTEVIQRRDLLINAVVSSMLFAVIYFFAFSIWLMLAPESISWWNMEKLSNIRLGLIPLEEIFFSLSLGLFAGPLYEYLTAGKIFNPKSAKRSFNKK